MTKVQVYFSVAAGKALIAKALAQRSDVQEALFHHTVVVVKGSTNRYLAEELLKLIGCEDYDLGAFFRGVVKPASVKFSAVPKEEDLVITEGKVVRGKSVYDVCDGLGAEDMMFKGANAVHLESGKAGVLIGNVTSGTMAPLMAAHIGRRTPLIHPVGVEKRVEDPIDVLAEMCNAADAKGLRLYPSAGIAYTELDALWDLFGVDATILASGGVGGYEGGCYFLIEGDDDVVAECAAYAKEVADLPMFEL